MGAQMSKEERDTIRRLSMTIPPSTDVKEVRSEKSRAVVAVKVNKQDDVEPGSP
jgi:hypothetical protein